MITLHVTIGGNLLIELENKKSAKRELKEIIEKATNTDAILTDLLETGNYLGNDWHAVDGCLTERPIIGWGSIYEEGEDFPTDYEKVWHYPQYELYSFSEILLKEGKVIFQKV